MKICHCAGAAWGLCSTCDHAMEERKASDYFQYIPNIQEGTISIEKSLLVLEKITNIEKRLEKIENKLTKLTKKGEKKDGI